MTHHTCPPRTARIGRWLLVLAVAAVLQAPAASIGPLPPVSAAWADDDDGGSGAGTGGASGGYGGHDGRRVGSSSVNPLRALRRFVPSFGRESPRPRRAARRAAPRPDRAEREIVATGLAEADITDLTARGYAVLQQEPLAATGISVAKLQVPEGTSIEEAREAVRAVNPAVAADFNHYYRPEQDGKPSEGACEGPHCAAPALIGWPLSPQACRQEVSVGLIDTAINADHAVFTDGSITVERLGSESGRDSDRKHGTAVAALLVGDPASRTPGLLPRARLHAVDAFKTSGGDTRAEAFDIVRAVDRIAARKVAVLNMSLAGPRNVLLEKAVADIVAAGTVVVAAVGNAGPKAETAYPAGYAQVIAVTAVDGRKSVYRRAVRGDHVDFAAPGVNVWAAASLKGARPRTGTSFAAPFVTAAVALIKASEPGIAPAEIEERLAGDAEDLGDEGRDAVFGWGLIKASGYCVPASDPTPTPVAANP